MLEQKWTRTNSRGDTRAVKRDVSSWNESLSFRWAVVKLVKDAEAHTKRGPPKIERLPDEDSPGTKTVNELLAEMRVRDSTSDERSNAVGNSVEK